MRSLNHHILIPTAAGFLCRKCFSGVLMLLLVGSCALHAQDSDSSVASASINVSGKVVAPTQAQSILLETVYSPSFQRASVSDKQLIVDPIADAAGSAGGAGLIIAQGLPDRSFRVAVPGVIRLSNKETSSTLEVQVSVSHNSGPDQSSSDYLRDSIREFTLNEQGEYYFWIGGKIDVSDVEPGPYEGQFVLELEYL